MRIIGWVSLLSLIIISLGAVTAYAQLVLDEDDHRLQLPLAVWTDLPLYDTGDPVIFRGHIKTLDANNLIDVTIRVVGPLVNGTSTNIVQIKQIKPQLDGYFQDSFFVSGPLWTKKGDYKIIANYGPQKAETNFFFNGGTGEPIISRPPPSIKCGPNEVLQNNVCVPLEPQRPACGAGTVYDPATNTCVVAPPPECPPGQVLSGGKCIDKEPEPQKPVCGPGTVANAQGICVPVQQPDEKKGCLIATAAYGSELAPQVQLLREVRDNVLLRTSSGTGFMTTFNAFYYSFSPTVADWERDSPIFKEVVKTAITPMLSTLSILNYVEIDSEGEMLGYGIGIILLNIGMYFVVPAVVIIKVRDLLRKKSP
jgi:hypothetical protein